MNTRTEDDAARRRGARIQAMRSGSEKIPFPESAAQDARPGNRDDATVLAMVEGRRIREQRERLRRALDADAERQKQSTANEVRGAGRARCSAPSALQCSVARDFCNESGAIAEMIGPCIRLNFA